MKLKTIIQSADENQCIVGVVDWKSSQCIFKLSPSIDFIIEHEFYILKTLYKICPQCIPKPIKLIQCKVPLNYYELKNPFKMSDEIPSIKIPCIILEQVKGFTLFEWLNSSMKDNKELYRIFLQIILYLLEFQRAGFTHYDLHSKNILLTPLDSPIINTFTVGQKEYKVMVNNQVTFIDFETSFIDNQHSLTNSLHYTKYDFIPHFDSSIDIRSLLCELSHYWEDLKMETFSFFSLFNMNYSNGANIQEFKGIFDYFDIILKKIDPYSELFKKEFRHLTLSIIQYMIQFPLQSNHVELDTAIHQFCKQFKEVSKEFYFIETAVRQPIEKLVILKQIVLCISKHEDIQPILGQHNIRLNANHLVDSLVSFAKAMESIMFFIFKVQADEIEFQSLLTTQCLGKFPTHAFLDYIYPLSF